MIKKYIRFFACFIFLLPFFNCTAQTTVYCSATGGANSYTTGYSTLISRLDGAVYVSSPAVSPTLQKGYAVFNLAALNIPANVTINSVTINLHFSYNGVLGLPVSIYADTTNLSTVSNASNLYNEISSGTQIYTPTINFGTSSLITLPSNAALVSFIQSHYNSVFSLGFAADSVVVVNSGTYIITGETGTGGSDTATAPTLAITYTGCTPTIAIFPGAGDTICSGASVTFSSNITYGGLNPTYQWKKNGTAISGATAATYTDSAINNGDVFSCVLTSSAGCATPNTATSNNIAITVLTSPVPSITIAATPGDTVCAGSPVSLSSTVINGGNAPFFVWKKNGTIITGATTSTYTTSTLSAGDVFSCFVTSNLACAVPDTASSNSLTMYVMPSSVPALSISVSPSDTICAGANVTFSNSITNGGTSPAYQWARNGSVISGATSSTYVTSTLADSDIISCIVTSSLPCAIPATVSSNGIFMKVYPVGPASVTISASPGDSICVGNIVTFTASSVNSGSNPTYQWYKNGAAITGANAVSYATGAISTGNVFYCHMVSDQQCISPTAANSDSITITVSNNATPSVTISASPGTVINYGTNVTFTAAVTNGGSSPQYQWRVNGANVPAAINSTYSSTFLNNGDVVSVVVLSNQVCVFPDSAHSNKDTMHVTGSAGINQIANQLADMNIYPNPNNGTFRVQVSDKGILHLFSVLGQEIYQFAIPANEQLIKLPADLTTGVYIGKFVTDKGIASGVFRILYEH